MTGFRTEYRTRSRRVSKCCTGYAKSGSRCIGKCLFTRIVNVTVFVSGTFDLWDGHLTDRMDVQPILSIEVSITIHTMLNFDADGDSNITCKQALKSDSHRTSSFLFAFAAL